MSKLTCKSKCCRRWLQLQTFCLTCVIGYNSLQLTVIIWYKTSYTQLNSNKLGLHCRFKIGLWNKVVHMTILLRIWSLYIKIKLYYFYLTANSTRFSLYSTMQVTYASNKALNAEPLDKIISTVITIYYNSWISHIRIQ